ncbi:hypothetical protein Bsp3421_005219 [Burkholderia sp. FERM BP-3421]|uniref:hypothetical protein n=1 Tax=Burkholderia sp. FERM BP-3421 TaxID=1494466 RepID=UPI00235FA2E2|nr:hypothetical protein [Burkholderia sp. FERM BP-3421]WDD95062.1 hypothetical protein Bsp3421_005219 [Burkholderia sp. FERM BP-3421]
MKRAEWGAAILLQAIGLFVGWFFLSGFFPEFTLFADGIEMLVVALPSLWMILFGRQLLRQPQALAQPAL